MGIDKVPFRETGSRLIADLGGFQVSAILRWLVNSEYMAISVVGCVTFRTSSAEGAFFYHYADAAHDTDPRGSLITVGLISFRQLVYRLYAISFCP